MTEGKTSVNPGLWWWAYNYMINNTKQMALDPFKPEKMQELLRTKPRIDAVVTVMQPNAIFAEIFDAVSNFVKFLNSSFQLKLNPRRDNRAQLVGSTSK